MRVTPLWALGSREIQAYRRNLFGRIDFNGIEDDGWISRKECLGAGIFLSADLEEALKARVEQEFGQLYVGCNE
jgi:hypothetical protein